MTTEPAATGAVDPAPATTAVEPPPLPGSGYEPAEDRTAIEIRFGRRGSRWDETETIIVDFDSADVILGALLDDPHAGHISWRTITYSKPVVLADGTE